jgi:hypothetical protein
MSVKEDCLVGGMRGWERRGEGGEYEVHYIYVKIA